MQECHGIMGLCCDDLKGDKSNCDSRLVVRKCWEKSAAANNCEMRCVKVKEKIWSEKNMLHPSSRNGCISFKINQLQAQCLICLFPIQ